MDWTVNDAFAGIVASVIEAVNAEVPDEDTRVRIYTKALIAFERADWSIKSYSESVHLDPSVYRAVHALHPEWFENSR